MFLLTLVACMAAGLGGEETDGIIGNDVAAPAFDSWEATSTGVAGDLSDSGSGPGSDTGDTAGPATLEASWSDGAIHCVHTGVPSACTMEPRGQGWTVEGTTIHVAYATFTDGDAPCAYTLAYDITGAFASGTWTVRANGEAASVVVP